MWGKMLLHHFDYNVTDDATKILSFAAPTFCFHITNNHCCDMLLHSFGTFDNAILTFNGHIYNTFNIQQYYTIVLWIALYMNHRIIFFKFEVKILTPSLV